MGQKVNPKGLRLGILNTWDSRWIFSDKKTFRETLLIDINLRKKLFERFQFASVTRVEIERAINKIILVIHTVKPGVIIGRGGKGLEEVKKLIVGEGGLGKNNKEKIKIDIKIEPVKKPLLNAYYVASEIARKLEKNFPYRIVVHQMMDRVIEAGANGVKIQLGGRIAGATISRREKYFQGTIPLSTIREDIDFAKQPALTKSGYIGVKVWIARKRN